MKNARSLKPPSFLALGGYGIATVDFKRRQKHTKRKRIFVIFVYGEAVIVNKTSSENECQRNVGLEREVSIK
jgi:hypothetical protein